MPLDTLQMVPLKFRNHRYTAYKQYRTSSTNLYLQVHLVRLNDSMILPPLSVLPVHNKEDSTDSKKGTRRFI